MNFNYDLVKRARLSSLEKGRSCGPNCTICNNKMTLFYYDLFLSKKKRSIRSSEWRCVCGGVVITDSCQHFNKMCFTLLETSNDC